MKKALLSILCLFGVISVSFAGYSAEEQAAYNYAFKNKITTMWSIDRANMWWNLTRVAMAKMLSNYAINVLWLKPDTSKDCYFSDISSSLDYQYDNWVTKSCQLWLMGVWIDKFYPNWIVTRAEFWTVLSRALNAKDTTKLNIMNSAIPYYSEHLNYLKEEWIMNNISNPTSFERRWRVMLMLMRADKNYTWWQIASYDELDDVVATCHHVDEMWWYDMWSYDYDICKNAFIIPYKDWYIGYELAWQDWIPFFLTYRKLDDPCTIISRTDEIFTWNPNYDAWNTNMCWDVYPDNKIFYAEWLDSWIPTNKVAKTLNCKAGNNPNGMSDDTCKKQATKYFYDLIVWNEEQEYFTKWMNKFKQDIDNDKFTTQSFWADKYFSCLQKVRRVIGEVQATDSLDVRCKYIKSQTEKMHECAIEYLK